MNAVAATSPALHGPALPPADPAAPRVLAGWHATGRPAGLSEHLRRYGPPFAVAHGTGTAMPLMQAVEEAGLTGRGGAGFPTGRKLRAVAARRGRAVVVVNAMESEPASRKDQFLLAVAPHLVLDGAVLAAAAVGAAGVHVCLSRTRTIQARQMTAALDERRRARLDRVPIHLHTPPHGYVTSESTALVHWLNGGEARPLSAPPRTYEKGVGGRPTLVQNAETLAHLALIARYGPAWFRQAGTPDESGTTLVTVSGAVRFPVVLEVPLGTPLSTLLERAGDPMEPPVAVLLGGYAGTWLPAGLLSTALARSALAPLGAAPGAGVVLILPPGACGLTETARILAYLAAHSARQCGPCLFGLPAVAEDFLLLAEGRADPALVARLRHRVGLLPDRGACRHPDGAARLAASALRVFTGDVEHHLAHGPCSAAHRLAVPLASAPKEWR
ncbi:NADH-ubiquinone oxidoreductase-F iron-sulfur binding region domain-containing protein [Streptomyces lydicus]|uniref:NADH-ubiquinone oxidoreductase-F iron-sulfur binding region domain-containing protein n=1 Tax=Streptomyces lydicus TaxID=47763 RepID=UPI0037D7AD55